MELVFETEADSDADYPDADLVIASDGINSRIRQKYAAVFQPDVVTRPNRFIWLGTTRSSTPSTSCSRRPSTAGSRPTSTSSTTDHHLHRRDARGDVWRRTGWTRPTPTQSIAFCEQLFAQHLQGHKLMTNARHLR